MRTGQSNWIFCRCSSLRFTLTSLPPFGPSGSRPTMPAADFCSSIGSPSDFPSPESGTDACRSPEVSSTAFPAQSPNLRSALLMDTDFAITSWLVPRSRLISGSCSSTRSFAPRFFQTGLAASSLRFANLHLHQVGRRLSLPSGRTCSAHLSGAPSRATDHKCRAWLQPAPLVGGWLAPPSPAREAG